MSASKRKRWKRWETEAGSVKVSGCGSDLEMARHWGTFSFQRCKVRLRQMQMWKDREGLGRCEAPCRSPAPGGLAHSFLLLHGRPARPSDCRVVASRLVSEQSRVSLTFSVHLCAPEGLVFPGACPLLSGFMNKFSPLISRSFTPGSVLFALLKTFKPLHKHMFRNAAYSCECPLSSVLGSEWVIHLQKV